MVIKQPNSKVVSFESKRSIVAHKVYTRELHRLLPQTAPYNIPQNLQQQSVLQGTLQHSLNLLKKCEVFSPRLTPCIYRNETYPDQLQIEIRLIFFSKLISNQKAQILKLFLIIFYIIFLPNLLNHLILLFTKKLVSSTSEICTCKWSFQEAKYIK